jgi:osmotically inducible protein OsmC
MSLFNHLSQTGCFLGALRAVAEKQGKKVPDTASIEVTTHLGEDSAGGFGIKVDIVARGVGDDALVKDAHAFCPYSKATLGATEVSVKAA